MSADASSSRLFTPTKVGAVDLKHRVVLAPLTRFRGDEETGALLSESSPVYYSQRSSPGGLLITEGTFVSSQAGGYLRAPGVFTDKQIQQWKKVTDAVHAKGGIIFAQLWYLGRAAPPTWKFQGQDFHRVSASETTIDGKEAAHAFTKEQIKQAVQDYAFAARRAVKEGGFDGVEIHGANGYLIDQFLQSVSNKRTDEYGGSVENRIRFALEVVAAVSKEIGEERVGIRMSPFSVFQGMREEKPLDLFVPYVEALLKQSPRLAFIHVVEPRILGNQEADMQDETDNIDPLREVVRKHVESRGEQENGGSGVGTKFIAAGGYKPHDAIEHSEKTGDLIAFGRLFIANPDLPARIKNGWKLNPYNRDTFYAAGDEGYIDYSFYEAEKEQEEHLGQKL